MNWLEISANVSPELVEPVVNLFEHYANENVVIETLGGYSPDEGQLYPISDLAKISVYIPNDELASDRCNSIYAGLRLLKMIKPIEIIDLKTLEQDDWENKWKDDFYPLSIGKRILIQPPWIQQEKLPDSIVINLNPGMAFGTGYHPTTKMCLELMEIYLQAGSRVLDIGAGSGILSFAACGLGASWVIGIDNDLVACQSAIEGIDLNSHLQFKGEFLNITLPDEYIREMDCVLVNISSNYFIDNSQYIFKCLKVSGILIASGFLEENLSFVLFNLTNSGFSIIEKIFNNDWCALVMAKDLRN